MPFIPVPTCALVEMRYTNNGQFVENTLWFELGDPPTEGTMSDLTAALLAWYQEDLRPLQSTNCQLREILATSMDSLTGPVFSLVPPTSEFGEQTFNPMPGNVTMAISFRTANRGRSFRGRNYAVGITEAQVDGNTFVEGFGASYQTAYEDLKEVALGVGWRWVVVSRFSGVDATTHKPIPRAEGLHTPVTAALVVDSFVDSQRRRLTTRGN